MSKPTKRATGSKKRTSDLAASLSRWVEADMGLSRDQLPSKEELKTLLGAGAGNGTWEYILTHINKPKTVQLVRKNIQFHSNDVTGRRSRLLTERAELNRELTSLRLAVTQLEGDLSRLKKNIATASDVEGAAEAETREWSRKSSFVSAHSVKCKDMVNVLDEFSKRIQHRIRVLSHQPKEKSYFAKAGASSAGGALQLETVCKRDLAVACDAVKSLLVQLAGERDGGAADNEREASKEQIWSRLESLLSDHAPSDLLQSLCDLTSDASGRVHAATSDVDLGRDAQLLRCKCDQSGGIIQEVGQVPKQEIAGTSLLKSVKDHLLILQLSHIQTSIESERYLQSAADARQRLSLLKAEVDSHISTRYHNDLEGAKLAKAVLEGQLEVSGSEGSLSALSTICDQLSSVREERRRALKTLEQKKERISQFTEIAEHRQSTIQALVRGNSTAWSTLHKQRNELEQYIRTKVLHHESELVPLAVSLHDSVNFELQRFSRLSLARMMRAPGSVKLPIPDLSIHRLCNTHPNGLHHLAEIAETVGVASYATPERLLSRLYFLLEQVEEARNALVEKEGAVEEVKKSSSESLPYTGVLLASKRCDRQQLESGVPALQQSLSVASQGLAMCTDVQQTLLEWWEQPAQLCGRWITYEGMSMEKWMDQWRVLAAKIQQLSSPHSQENA